MRKYPARNGDFGHKLKLHLGPKNTETLLANRMHTEKIGLESGLSSACQKGARCGECFIDLWMDKGITLVPLSCPEGEEDGCEMLKASEFNDCETLLTANANLNASAKIA